MERWKDCLLDRPYFCLSVQEADDSPLPPAKGYNLDFLDNLDDPNFNPFETKTAIKDNFGTSTATAANEASSATPAAVDPSTQQTDKAVDEQQSNKTEEKKSPPSMGRACQLEDCLSSSLQNFFILTFLSLNSCELLSLSRYYLLKRH